MDDALVIIPVYNEAASVQRVLARARECFAGPILAVDDGSTDGTGRLLSQVPDIVVLRHTTNRGYGASLRDGFAYAQSQGYRYVITLDADEQHEPCRIGDFLSVLAQGEVDIVSGSRYLTPPPPGSAVPPERLRLNRLITSLLNELTGWQLTDAFCGFKGYRVESLRRLTLTEPGYALPLQLWIQAWKAGLRITEVPVDLIYKPNFERRFGGGLDDPAARLRYYLQVIGRELQDEPMAAAQQAHEREVSA
ncbi:MAG: glycosyltransferase family 2 protein [Limnochordaceae bacterium]|nr:glycosyltransferase family 2 protein [Limnochordaceae bacterium]